MLKSKARAGLGLGHRKITHRTPPEGGGLISRRPRLWTGSRPKSRAKIKVKIKVSDIPNGRRLALDA
jgi:hypothetical protein